MPNLSYQRSRIAFPKKKKPKKSYLKRKADRLFSEKIRKQGFCSFKGLDDVKCGGSLQPMHIIGRANLRLRWDIENVFCGCSGHHIYYTNHPFEFYELIKSNWPNIYKYLQKHRNELWDGDYSKVLADLELCLL